MEKICIDFLVLMLEHIAMNTLDRIRADRGLTFEALGRLIGVKRHVAWKHCQEVSIPAEAAIRYSAAMGIPLELLRPDLPPPVVSSPTSPTQEAQG